MIRFGKLALFFALIATYTQFDRLLRPTGLLPGLPRHLAPKGEFVRLSHGTTFYQLNGPIDGKI
jgi:hypothetical protein